MVNRSGINNYNGIARFYDNMSKLIFGNALINAQRILLQFPFPGSRVIIVGGGTGLLLEDITNRDIPPLEITYVELSDKMLLLAQARNFGHHKVIFVHSSIEDFIDSKPFDVVITPFLFDNFSRAKAEKVFYHLDTMLHKGGIWLFTDFYLDTQSPLWQKGLLKIMYSFFKRMANIEADTLPDISSLFERSGYEGKAEYFFLKRFIQSYIYCKSY